MLYEKIDGIAYITLNRPGVLNAINVQMRDDLYQVFFAIRDDPEVVVGIVRGAGERAFSAGADLSEFGTAPSPTIARQVRWERDLWGLILGLKTPLIAAIQGYALGAGLELALCCDIRVASPDAQFGLPEVALGMIPAAGGTQTLPRTIPRGMALGMMLTAERIGVQEALRVGLIQEVVPKEELITRVEELAKKVASYGALTLRLAKEAVTGGLEMKLEEGLRLERDLAWLLHQTRSRSRGRPSG